MRLAEPSAHIKRSANGGLPWLFTQHCLTLQGNTRGKKATKVILNFLDTITKAKRPPEAIYPRGQAERLHPSLRLKPTPAATQLPPATLEQHRLPTWSKNPCPAAGGSCLEKRGEGAAGCPSSLPIPGGMGTHSLGQKTLAACKNPKDFCL